MRKPVRIAIGVGALALVLLAWRACRPGDRVSVEAVKVERGTVLDSITATTTGTVSADSQAILSARVSGQVVEIRHAGDAVKAGEPVARIDDAPYRAAVVQSEGALAAAKGDMARLESGRRMRVQGMGSERDRAEAVFEKAKKNFEQSQKLREEGIISDQAFQIAEADFRVAEAGYRSALAGLDDREVMDRELKAAAGRVLQAEGALENAKLQLDWCSLDAPFDGVIGETRVRVGELVAPGQLIASLYGLRGLYVETAVDEVDLGSVSIGQPARLLFDSFPGEELAGTVRRIAPVVSARKLEGRTGDVEIAIEDSSGRVRPGMSVDSEIIVSRTADSLWVPTNAVMSSGSERFVWTVRRGKARRSPIKMGTQNWERTEVLEGIREGDVVIVSFGRELKDGTLVRLETPQTAPRTPPPRK